MGTAVRTSGLVSLTVSLGEWCCCQQRGDEDGLKFGAQTTPEIGLTYLEHIA